MRQLWGIPFLAAVSATLVLSSAEGARACDTGTELLISEFMASNASTLTDKDGDYSDWIEIYDPCLPSVDLDGWYLTDDPANLTKWRFPSVQLSRGGFLLVFASGKDRAIAGFELHTNFKLGADGEYLALVKPDGTTIAHAYAPQFPAQFPDVSFGFPQSAATPVAAGAQARFHVPTIDDEALDAGWTEAGFDDTAWGSGPTGLGYAGAGSGRFDVSCYRANVQVPDLGTAAAVLADPALQSSVQTERPTTINYLNTGTGAHFAGDLPFPGTQLNVDANDFVVLATASVVIPTAGPWTFGVNSDDGFSLELSRQPHVFTSSYPSARGAGDTLAVFDIPEPGTYALRLIYFERSGGSELELFAAPGSLSSFSSAFHLVGDTAAGGLPVAELASLIGTDVRADMQGVNASLWGRIGFDMADPGAVDLLTLRMAYEDGFVAYLNGVEVARRNAPAALHWNSTATVDRPVDDAVTFEPIDLTDVKNVLLPGANVLAVLGLNEDRDDDTFFALPELATAGPTPTGAPVYFSTPTPASFNGSGFPGVSGSPAFSRENGLFTSPFALALSTAAPGAVIRFTLDGSDPSETNGSIYTALSRYRIPPGSQSASSSRVSPRVP